MSGAGLANTLVLALTVIVAASCAQTLQGNAQIADAFARRASGLEVTADGVVERLLSDEPGPDGTHERFVMRLDGSTQTVLVAHNISIAPRVPVAAGNQVTVHGEYVWNEQGGLIHFTHHDPQHRHEDGYIVLSGTRYSTRALGQPVRAALFAWRNTDRARARARAPHARVSRRSRDDSVTVHRRPSLLERHLRQSSLRKPPRA